MNNQSLQQQHGPNKTYVNVRIYFNLLITIIIKILTLIQALKYTKG